MANTPSLPSYAGKELGASGTLEFHGIIVGEEYNRVLRGRAALQQYDIMRRSDSTVRSALQVCKLPLLSTTWKLEPARQPDGSIDPADQEHADFISRELFHDEINFQDFIRQSLGMFDFGFAVFEKVLRLTDFNGQPRIGLAKLAPRKQTTIYAWIQQDGTPGITQATGVGTYNVPMDKLIIFTNDKEGDNYDGISLLRYVYKDWDIKDKLTLVNALALEKMAVGVPVISEDPNVQGVTVDPGAMEKAEEALRKFRANDEGYLKVPKGMTIQMLDMKASTVKDVIPTLQYHDSKIWKAVLAGFMDLGGTSGSGAKALSQDLTSLFFKSLEAVANNLVATINEQLIKPLCDLNYSDLPNGYPTLKYGTIGDDDVTVVATAVNQLMTAGAIQRDDDMEDRLRQILKLPALPQNLKEANDSEAAPAAKETAPIAKDELAVLDKQTSKQEAALRSARRASDQLIDVILKG